MKRIQYHRYGGPEELRLEDAERPSPAKGEVLVRVIAASANPMDWGLRKGDAKLFTGSRFPRGLGHDFAGIVEAVGAGVAAFTAGDEVLGATDRGRLAPLRRRSWSSKGTSSASHRACR